MLHTHPNARTTPAVRAEIARSTEPSSVVAQRYGISTETVRKWRKRGAEDSLDHSARPHRLPWKATNEERAVVCALRQLTNFVLDDLTFAVTHFLPHRNRDSIFRILKAEGLNRRAKPFAHQPAKGEGTFKDYNLGFAHIDIKLLPKLQTADREWRKRYLFVAIDRRSRSVHLAVKDNETDKSATACKRLIMATLSEFGAIWFVSRVATSGACWRQWQPQRQLHRLGLRSSAIAGVRTTRPFRRGWSRPRGSSAHACVIWRGSKGSARA